MAPSHALDLLAQGLDLLEEHPRSAFLHRAMEAALEELTAQPPVPLALPDGRSILVALSDISLPLAMSWYRHRGPEVWLATPATPQPLGDVFYRWLATSENTTLAIWMERATAGGGGPVDLEELAQFVEDGMRLAMPLRSTDFPAATRWPVDRRTQASTHQERIVRACVLGAPWANHEALLRMFQAYDGEWVVDSLDPEEIIRGPTMTPKTVVSMVPRNSQAQRGAFVKLWALDGYRDDQHVYPWLIQQGVDVEPLQRDQLSAQLEQLTKHTKGSHQRVWEQIVATVNASPVGHLLDPTTQLPFWLVPLYHNPAMLGSILRVSGPQLLAVKSDSGKTVWDALLFSGPLGAKNHPTWAPVEELLEHVPFDMASTTGVLWGNNNNAWMRTLAKHTMLSHPQHWLGAQPLDGALDRLALLSSFPSSDNLFQHAEVSFILLAELWQASPTTLPPELVGVLSLAKLCVQQQPDRFVLTAPVFSSLELPPLADEPAWLGRLESHMDDWKYSTDDASTHEAAAFLRRFIKRAKLKEVVVPTAPTAPPKLKF
jgi:hypothetical protein